MWELRMNFRLIKAHRTKGCDVVVYGRDDQDDKVCFVDDKFKPYFYCLADESCNESGITGGEWGFQSIYGDQLRKVYVWNPSEVPRLRDIFTKTWEADIVYPRRWLIDKMITSGFNENLVPCEPAKVDIHKTFLDIEVYSKTSMPNPENDKVTCFTLYDSYEQTYVSGILDDVSTMTSDDNWVVGHFDNERDLLKYLDSILYFIDTDVVSGWNIGWDIDYLKARCAKYNIKLPLDSCCVFDLLETYRKLYRQKSYRLKDIALFDGFADTLEEKVNYGELWEKDKVGLLTRNKRHTEWVKLIDEKRKIIDYFWNYKEICGLEEPQDTIHNSVIIETMLLRRAHAVLPSKVQQQHNTFEGAIVIKPEAGIFSNIAVFDLKTFYPTILISNNLDPIIIDAYKKLNEKLDWEKYHGFSKEYLKEGKQTIVLSLVKELMEERRKLQSSEHIEKLAAIKAVLNSVYGVFGSGSFRLFTPEIPERIAEIAREIIIKLKDKMTSLGYKNIYVDTDSLFLQSSEQETNKLLDLLNNELKKYGDYSIKLEHFFQRILFTGAKKRYCAWDGKNLYFTGFDRIRSDSSEFTKQIQEDVLRMMLTDKSSEVIPYLRTKVAEIKQCDLKDIAITKTLSRELEAYDKVQQNYIKAIKKAGLDIHEGDAINIIPAKNYPYEVAVFRDIEDLSQGIDVDWDKVIEQQIERKVEDLLPLIGSSWDEVSGNKMRLF